MITKINCQAIIEGANFTPNILNIPPTVKVLEKYSKGDVIKFGRYKGNLSSEGYLIIDGGIDEIINFLTLKILTQFSREIIDLNLCILVSYEGECNFELSQTQLDKIAKLHIPLAITCYNKT